MMSPTRTLSWGNFLIIIYPTFFDLKSIRLLPYPLPAGFLPLPELTPQVIDISPTISKPTGSTPIAGSSKKKGFRGLPLKPFFTYIGELRQNQAVWPAEYRQFADKRVAL